MTVKTNLEKAGSDTPQPNGSFKEVHINPRITAVNSFAVSSPVGLDKTIIIHDTSLEKILVPFSTTLDARRRANLLANRGPDSNKPSTSE